MTDNRPFWQPPEGMQYKWWIRATGNAVLLLVLAVLVLLLGGAVSYGMGWL